ncbi:MAG: tRNA (adenosine(37)-N6)-dimethylallyltransferase MiaA [Candidatus Hinthialibacter sp.]
MKNTNSRGYNQRTIDPPLKFCAVVGPTASGKTELALALAERSGADILCVDAMQTYRGLDVGSAKPTREERARAAHYGLDVASPLESFSASRFAQYAEPLLAAAREKNRPLILCGGTGLYYRSLLEGLFEAPDPDPDLRARLNERAVKEGSAALYAELSAADPETAGTIHPNDARRVTRALEIIAQTGMRVSELRRRQQKKGWIEETCFIGLQRDPADLDERIEARTQWMYENGLIEETVRLLMMGCTRRHTALQALGYKECYDYLQGRCSLAEARERTAKETKRYARRQYTWFRRQFPTHWIRINNCADFAQIVKESLQLWRNSDNNIQKNAKM